MRITKKWLRETKAKLMEEITRIVAVLTATEAVEEVQRTCGFKVTGDATDNDVRLMLLKWMIHDAIPGHMTD